MAPKWPQVNNGPEHINEHATYLREACNQLQAVDRGRHNQVPWNIVQPYLESTILLIGKVLRQPALREILQQVRDAAKCTQMIQNDVTVIKNSVGLSTAPLNASNFSGARQRSAATWAQVAAHAKGSPPLPPPVFHNATSNKNQTTVTAYKDRTITVKLKDNGIIQRHRTRPASWTKQQIETAVRNNSATTSIKVVAAHQLKSGDIQIVANTTEEAKKLKENQGWIKSLGENAELIVPTYGVIVHGIPTNSLNIKDQEPTIQQMLADNHTVIPNAKISFIGWLTKEAPLKRASSIVVEFKEPEMANAIIYAGMVWDGQIHQCQLYDRACRVKQCFRCYNYGHIGTQCNASQTCGYCAEQHESKHCPRKGAEGFAPRCAVCKDAHTAWSNACPARKKELQRVEQAKESRDIYWHVPPKGPPTHPGITNTNDTLANDTNSTDNTRGPGSNKGRAPAPASAPASPRLITRRPANASMPIVVEANSPPEVQSQQTQTATATRAAPVIITSPTPPNPTVEDSWATPEHLLESAEQPTIDPRLTTTEEPAATTPTAFSEERILGFSTREADDWLQRIGLENDWLDEAEDDSSPLTSVVTDTRTAQGQIYKGCTCAEHQEIYSNWPTHSAELTIARCMKTCTYCGKDFETTAELRKHMRKKYERKGISIVVEKRNRWGATTPAWTHRRHTESPPRQPAIRITRSQSVTDSTSERRLAW